LRAFFLTEKGLKWFILSSVPDPDIHIKIGYNYKNVIFFFIRNHFFLLHKNNNLTIKKENINYLQKQVFTQKG